MSATKQLLLLLLLAVAFAGAATEAEVEVEELVRLARTGCMTTLSCFRPSRTRPLLLKSKFGNNSMRAANKFARTRAIGQVIMQNKQNETESERESCATARARTRDFLDVALSSCHVRD